MKTKPIKIIWIMVLVVLSILSIAAVKAIPPAPEQYWGYIYVEGSLVPSGTVLTIESYDSEEVFVNQTLPYDSGSPGSYFFNLPFDDLMTDEDEGANESEKLTFKVNGISTLTPLPGSETAEAGEVNNNLTITGILNPSISMSASYSNTTEINERISVTLTLRNTGHGSANVVIDEISDKDLTVTGLPQNLTVAKNSTKSTNIRIKPTSCGSYSKRVDGDYYNLAGALVGGISKRIRFETKGHDIEVESVEESATSLKEGELVDITVKVTNVGDYNISNYTMKLYDNNELIKTDEITADLGVSDYTKKTYSLNLSRGVHHIKAKAMLDEDECSTSNNDKTSSTIIIEEKKDPAAIAVERTGSELLARVRFDKSRLNSVLDSGDLSINFIVGDIEIKIRELEEYESTILDTQASGIAAEQKNKTYTALKEKLDSLEKSTIYLVREIQEKEYNINSSFVDSLANYENESTAGIIVNVRLIEAESLSYNKSSLTRIEINITNTTSLQDIALIAVIPREITEADLIYESVPEVLQKEPLIISWNASSEIIYYIAKDAYENAEDIDYLLIPQDKKEESLPLIQGFAVKAIEKEKPAWETLLTVLIIILVLSMLIYRIKGAQINWKGMYNKSRLASMIGKQKKDEEEETKKGNKKVTLEELYKRFGEGPDYNKDSEEEIKVEEKKEEITSGENQDEETEELEEKQEAEQKVEPKEFEKAEKDYASAHLLLKVNDIVHETIRKKEYRKQRRVMLENMKENFQKAYGDIKNNCPKHLYKPKRRYQVILENIKQKINAKKSKNKDAKK